MNEPFKRRLVGLLTLVAIALLLSWLLPRPGLRRLEGAAERVAAMDLTRPGSPAEEILAEPPAQARSEGDAAPKPVPGGESSTLFPLPADPEVSEIGEAPASDAERIAAESAAAEKAASAKPAEKPAPPVQKIETGAVAPAPAKPAPATVKPATTAPPTATPPKPAPVPASPAKPASAASTWFAQCGVYSQIENAQSVRDDLVKRGLGCIMAPIDAPKGTMYRVRCGPFKTRGEAEIVASRIRDRVPAIVVDGAH